jgi:hypothetical protein
MGNKESNIQSRIHQRNSKRNRHFSPKINGDARNIASALGITATAFTIMWKSDKNMGRNEFSKLLNSTIESMDEFY